MQPILRFVYLIVDYAVDWSVVLSVLFVVLILVFLVLFAALLDVRSPIKRKKPSTTGQRNLCPHTSHAIKPDHHCTYHQLGYTTRAGPWEVLITAFPGKAGKERNKERKKERKKEGKKEGKKERRKERKKGTDKGKEGKGKERKKRRE